MAKMKRKLFKWQPLSAKQKQVMTWWTEAAPDHIRNKNGIICDGAIRSGKTVTMSFSFVILAMERHNGLHFGMAGKTIGSFRRNVLFWLKVMLLARGYTVTENRSDKLMTVRKGNVENYFYIFGGKDESSQDLLQGVTLVSFFFDEVALMPESFVNQAIGRCSHHESTYWYNCNPGHPDHFFKRRFIDSADEKGLIHLHFTMDDNLSLSEKVKERYRSMYQPGSVFFRRYILGEWCLAEGIIFDNFKVENFSVEELQKQGGLKLVHGLDFGFIDPTAFISAYVDLKGRKLYIFEEHYQPGMNNTQIYSMLEKKSRNRSIITCDSAYPGAIHELRMLGAYNAKGAKKGADSVINGIKFLSEFEIFILPECKETFKEFSNYTWRVKDGLLLDEPVDKYNHLIDALRYAVEDMQKTANGQLFDRDYLGL